MAAKNRTRQQVKRQRVASEARAAAAAARRRKKRQRAIVIIVAAAVPASVALGAFFLGGDGGDKTAGGSTSTTKPTRATSTTVPATQSAAGKPCVPVADAPPPDAPPVPVKVGPPPTQLVSEDLELGSGAAVTAGETVTVNYIGVSCSTGKIFDSSYSRNQPETFPLSGVIRGWQDGIPGMKVGGRRLLGVPPAQAYGSQGRPPTISPDETLWFVVEVLDTKAP